MDFDFLSTLESGLGAMDGLDDEPERGEDCTPDGDHGTLNVQFENGRKYEIKFTRLA